MKTCINCHIAFENETQFCTSCGWRLAVSPVAPNTNQSLNQSANEFTSIEGTSKSRNMLYFTIMVVAVSISAIVLTLLFTRGEDKGVANPSGENVTATSEPLPSVTSPEVVSQNYIPEMNLLLTEYSSSRTSLSKFVTRIDSREDVSVSEAESFFDTATNQRQSILDDMNALVPPEKLVSNHREIVSLVTRAIAAMESANIGIAACDYGTGDCEIGSIPAWQEFRSESKKITPLYNSALKAWKKAAGIS